MAEPVVQQPLTFADIGNDPATPRIEEFDPLSPPEPKEPAPVVAKTEPVAPAPQAPQGPPQPSWSEQMAAFQYAQQQAAQQERQQTEWNRQMEAMYTPPPMGDAAEVLTDPKRYEEERQRLAQWAANLQRTNQQWTAQAFQEMQNRINQGQMSAVSLAGQTRATDDMVAQRLADEGYSNVGAVLMEVDRALQSNPQTYMRLRLDPESVTTAARFFLQQSGTKPQPVGERVASNPNMPYSRATQNSASGGPAGSSAALRAAEARLGRKLSPKYAERFGRSHERLT